jgi:F0F1-type ATP synthase assembly protein I
VSTEKTNPKPKRPSEKSNALLQYSDLGFRMAVMIGAGAYIGHTIDQKMALATPIFSIVLSLLAIGGAMYMVIQTVSKK